VLGTYAFYVASTVKNRVLARIRRLKQPRYLVGLFVGLAYLVVVFSRSGPRPVQFDGQTVPIDAATGGAMFTLIVAVVMILAWALPDSEAGLDLTETEALFLFPAPITRAQLLGFVLARGLFPLLITALILKILFLRGASFAGLLAALVAAHVYFLMVRLARARLAVAGVGFVVRAVAALVVLSIIASITYMGYASVVPAILEAADHEEAAVIMSQVSTQPLEAFPLNVVYFLPGVFVGVAGASSLVGAVVPSIVLACVTGLFGWIAVRLDVSYEEATIARARRRAERREARWKTRRGEYVSKRSLIRFPLAPEGRPEIAILWKNSMAASRTLALVFVLPLALIGLLALVVTIMTSPSRALPFVAVVSFAIAAFSTLFGPVLFRNDLRSDMRRLDLLRGYPLTGRQIVGAEIASPALLIVTMQAGCLIAGLATGVLSGQLGSSIALAGWAVLAFCFAMPLTIIQLLVHNGLVVLFPGWASFSKEDSRGIEAFGRRILLLIAQLFTLMIGLVPAGLVFAVAFFLSKADLASPVGSLIVASVVAFGVLAFEIGWAVSFLGHQLERIDPSDDLAIAED
jgi:hypothetical protein